MPATAELDRPVEQGGELEIVQNTLVLGGIARDYNRNVSVEILREAVQLAFGDKVGLNDIWFEDEPEELGLRLKFRMVHLLTEEYGWSQEAVDKLFDITQHETVGGAGANNVRSAKYLKRALGIKGHTVLAGISSSSMVDELFTIHGIDKRFIFDGDHTLSLIFNPEGTLGDDRAAYVMRGPQITVEQFDEANAEVNPTLTIVSSLGGDMELLAHVQQNAGDITLNPGGKEIRQGDELMDIAQGVAILSLNEVEAERFLTGNPELKKITKSPELTAEQLSRKLGKTASETLVVVTNGENGMYLSSNQGNNVEHVPAVNTDSQGRKKYKLGAGDVAFASISVARVQAGLGDVQSAQLGSEASSRVVRSPETYASPEYALFSARAVRRAQEN